MKLQKTITRQGSKADIKKRKVTDVIYMTTVLKNNLPLSLDGTDWISLKDKVSCILGYSIFFPLKLAVFYKFQKFCIFTHSGGSMC